MNIQLIKPAKKLIISIVVLTGILIFSCEDENKNFYSGPEVISFSGQENDFIVQDSKNPYDTIWVTSTKITGTNRTVFYTISDSSTAIYGVHYKLLTNNAIVIPANSCMGYIVVEGIYTNLVDSGAKELILNINQQGYVDAAVFDNKYTLTLNEFCPVILEDFKGHWTDIDNDNDDYEIAITSDPDKLGDTLIMNGLLSLTDTIKLILNYSDPSDFYVEIPNQRWFNLDEYQGKPDGNNGYYWIKQTKKGKFSACDMTMTLYYSYNLKDKPATPTLGTIKLKKLPDPE